MYCLQASVFTKYPTIVDLQGKTSVNQTDVAAVQGYTEYMGSTVADRVMVGVQRKSTLPTLYNISSDMEGKTIQVRRTALRVPCTMNGGP
jgi:hypothetical protein